MADDDQTNVVILLNDDKSLDHKYKYNRYCKNYIQTLSVNRIKYVFTIQPNLNEYTWLRYLDCSDCGLVQLPDLSSCQFLEVLQCSFNELTILPYLGNCTLLKKLICCYNRLIKLPCLSKCTLLEIVDCSNNNITHLPDFGNCINLIKLWCGFNDLVTLPDLTNCKLQQFCCSNNMIGIISQFNGTNLMYFNCSNNNLFSLPYMGCYSRLKIFFCNNNPSLLNIFGFVKLNLTTFQCDNSCNYFLQDISQQSNLAGKTKFIKFIPKTLNYSTEEKKRRTSY